MNNKILTGLILASFLFGGVVSSGCITTGDGTISDGLDGLSEEAFQRIKLYGQLTIQLAGDALLEDGKVTQNDLENVANALEAIKDTPVVGGTEFLVETLLANAGLTSAEAEALAQIVIFELEAAGLFSNLNLDGTIILSVRALDLVNTFIFALRDAANADMDAFMAE